MQIIFSPRGNGACPLCQRREDCRLHEQFREGLADSKGGQGSEMEVVVYSCPLFVESV